MILTDSQLGESIAPLFIYLFYDKRRNGIRIKNENVSALLSKLLWLLELRNALKYSLQKHMHSLNLSDA